MDSLGKKDITRKHFLIMVAVAGFGLLSSLSLVSLLFDAKIGSTMTVSYGDSQYGNGSF